MKQKVVYLVLMISLITVIVNILGISIQTNDNLDLANIKTKQKAGIDRLKTLPYANWGATVNTINAKSGVTFHNRKKSWQGINVMVNLGNIIFFDMQGNIKHQVSAIIEKPRNLAAFAIANSFAVFALSSRLTKLDIKSQKIWNSKGILHHDFDISSDGKILVLGENTSRGGKLIEQKVFIDNSFITLSPEGVEEEKLSFAFVISKDKELAAQATLTLEKENDIFHLNTLKIIDKDLVKSGKLLFPKGSIIFCSRSLNMFGVLDLKRKEIIWKSSPAHKLIAPHSPRLLANGNFIVFDNGNGTRKYSRILEIDPLTNQIVWEYQASPAKSFYSYFLGNVEELPNSNLLVTESTNGRAFEITRSKEIVWEYYTPFLKALDKKSSNETQLAKRAIIPAVKRYSADDLKFIN